MHHLVAFPWRDVLVFSAEGSQNEKNRHRVYVYEDLPFFGGHAVVKGVRESQLLPCRKFYTARDEIHQCV